jgi:hypothetical protein
MSPHDRVDPTPGGHEKPLDVPVFSCIVLVSPEAGGGVRARIANLAGFECTAASERQALAQLIPAFRTHVADLLRAGTPIPWIDPPVPAEPNEQKRWVPVHL